MTLKEHQKRGVDWLLRGYKDQEAGRALGWEMGLGKTLTVLTLIREVGAERSLITCPSIARNEWLRQIRLFYPEWEAHTFVGSDSKTVAAWEPDQKGIFITGYNPKLTSVLRGAFDVVAPDECQEISNPDVQTSKLVAGVVNRSENTYILPMSGTPSMDRVEQIWHIGSLCQPGQWGDNLGWFKWRYLNRIPNQYSPSGFMYKGLREDRRAELEKKIASFMHRLRKEDVALDLPPLTISLRYVKPKRSKLDWEDESAFSELVSKNSSQKIDTTVDIIEEARRDGQTRFVVFTFLRDTAQQLAGRLGALGLETELVDGSIPADKRGEPIQRIRGGGGVLVCTIDSVGVALDFTFAETAVFAEQHWQPGATSQALGRLHRLSSTHPVSCYFVVCEGTVEEKKALSFVRKMQELEAVVAKGKGEADTMKALDRKEDDASILAELGV